MTTKDSGASPMSGTVAYIADRLVRTEMIESQVKRPEAERIVARRAGLSASTLDELRRGRTSVDYIEHIGPKIRAVFVRFLEKQLAALESELVVARALDREVDFRTAEVAIAQAKKALGK